MLEEWHVELKDVTKFPTGQFVRATGIPFLIRPNGSKGRRSRTVGHVGCRTKGSAIISTKKKVVGIIFFPLLQRANIPTNELSELQHVGVKKG